MRECAPVPHAVTMGQAFEAPLMTVKKFPPLITAGKGGESISVAGEGLEPPTNGL